jgi:hypothetical protein
LTSFRPEDVNVQLRPTVAADVLREYGHRDLVGILAPAGLHAIDPPAVMTGPHTDGLRLARTDPIWDLIDVANWPRSSHRE